MIIIIIFVTNDDYLAKQKIYQSKKLSIESMADEYEKK